MKSQKFNLNKNVCNVHIGLARQQYEINKENIADIKELGILLFNIQESYSNEPKTLQFVSHNKHINVNKLNEYAFKIASVTNGIAN